ncbi:hypothetical protein FJ546_03065 [Mesorhizobium sp. B2-4-19]|uniref:hypothetical protein n=1 Tax=Mesorhizobium sp. B2-4-19 TaxID=2589930 RepID=UPI001126B449|nr:hypothetical protein [Mesorhizobium sp. B2-4-19]TPK69588.1 hypothetical protein FJ546_03065 [Mesorhizobium sp. B2-4-19]
MAKAIRHPETRDVRPRTVLGFGAGLLVFLAAAAIAIRLIFDTTPVWPLPGASTSGSQNSPALQRTPESDLVTFRAQEDQELQKLGWVDRNAGIARIPIDEAMRALVSHGLPNWGQPAATTGGGNCALLEGVPRSPQADRCGGSAPDDRGASR